MILYLDTTANHETKIILFSAAHKLEKVFSNSSSEDLPELIKQYLKQEKISFDQIQKIAIRTGEGYFSRIRSGVVAANALAFALGVEVVTTDSEPSYEDLSKLPGKAMVLPKYSREPNITAPKKRK